MAPGLSLSITVSVLFLSLLPVDHTLVESLCFRTRSLNYKMTAQNFKKYRIDIYTSNIYFRHSIVSSVGPVVGVKFTSGRGGSGPPKSHGRRGWGTIEEECREEEREGGLSTVRR